MSRTAAVVLAAGNSSRFGRLKQLEKLDGESLINRIVRNAATAHCQPIIVVTGAQSDLVRSELEQGGVTIVENPSWQSGIGTSIKTGVRAAQNNQTDLAALILLVCDQPAVNAEVIKQLCACHQVTGKAIIASRYAGALGTPALFDQSCFDDLLALPDDEGAKAIITRDPGRVGIVPFAAGELDIDTPADLIKIRAAPMHD